MKKHFCDSCGKELNPGTRFTGSWHIESTWIKVKLEIRGDRDYCWSCVKKDVIHALDLSYKQNEP